MSSLNPKMDAAFREFAELELLRHYLLLQGQENSSETLEAEGRMEALWENLDETQRQSLKGIASDLNWVRRKGEPPPKGRKEPGDVPATDQQELITAIGSKEWMKILHYARLCAPLFPVPTLAQLRGKVFEDLGLPAYTDVFCELAADLDPANADIGLKALSSFMQTDPAKAIRRSEEILAWPLRYPPAVVAYAATVVLRRDKSAGLAIDRQRFSGILGDIVKRLQLEPANESSAGAYHWAASGFERIGDLKSALDCLDEGLRRSPNHDDLLVFKGIMLYESDPDQAVHIFDRLTRRATANVWPYVHLAHFHLRMRNYSASLEMGREAWARTTKDPLKASLLEWQAICLTELQYPPEVVRPVFQQAIALDPSNVQITRNLEQFDKRVSGTNHADWGIENSSYLRTQQIESVHTSLVLAQ